MPVRIGGIEVYVAALAKGLQQAGHNVRILVPSYPGEAAYPPEVEGIELLTYTEYKNTTRAEFSGSVKGKGLAAFTSILKAQQPDVVHFHQLTSSNGISLFHINAAKQTGAKVVFTNHLAVFESKRQPLANNNFSRRTAPFTISKNTSADNKTASAVTKQRPVLLFKKWMQRRRNSRSLRAVFNLSDAVFVLTDWYAAVLQQHGLYNETFSVVKQGLATTTYTLNKKIPGAELKLVYAGRIFPDKGVHVLLQAIKQLSTTDVSLSIYGQIDGEEYAAYCKGICGNAGNITWHPPIKSSEVIATLSAYDCLVIPTIVNEMAPLIIQEAFAARLPVIGSNSGGIKEEIADGGNGLLFTPGNVAELGHCIEKLIADRPLLNKFQTHIPTPRLFQSVVDAVEKKYTELTTS